MSKSNPTSSDSLGQPVARAESLVPVQHRASRAFRIAADVRVQRMLKHPYLSEFHSIAEHLYAGLLEGTPSVTCYVPQPFRLRIGKRRYTPDCYVVDGDQRRVLELKPRGEFDEALHVPLVRFFAVHGMTFEVVSNESVFARVVEAQNWLELVRALHLNRDLNTEVAEDRILDRMRDATPVSVGDFVDPGNRADTLYQEIALFRLMHRGVVRADLHVGPFDYNIQVDWP